nr:epididymal protein 13 isoform X2 [Equus asinus]
MGRSELFLKMSLLILLFLGLAEACIPREVAIEEKIKLLKGILGMMSRLSLDGLRQSDHSSKMPSPAPQQDRTEEEMKILKQILGLMSLQALSEERNGCKEEETTQEKEQVELVEMRLHDVHLLVRVLQ